MSQDTLCFAKPSDPLPAALWVPSNSYRIYRGCPTEMVLEMAVGDVPPETELSVRAALQKLTGELLKAQRVHIQLPWRETDETLSALFLHALSDLGLSRVVPSA